MSASTAKSFDGFEACFVAIQESQSRPSWLVASENGGRISNEGTPGVDNPYRIRFSTGGPSNRVQAFVGRNGGADQQALVEAVKRCL